MKSEIRIVIADDHPIFRSGLRTEIEKVSGLKIVAEAEDGESALEWIQTLRPEIAILDVKMPNRNGFEVMRGIQEKKLPVAVIFLTMHKDERIFTAALDKGAKGYVLKDGAVNEIVAAIKAVSAGENFISPSLSTYLVKRRRRDVSLAEQMPTLRHLTAAEWRVLCLIAANKTSKEIADELFIAESTVNKHRENICRKLDLHGSHALLNFALDHKSELSDSSRL
jgi:DNA-binding NarL/FixJ family response regulator